MPYDKVVSGPLYMKFRKIPTPLALPFAWFPIKRDVRSHGILLPSYGDGGQLGFFSKTLDTTFLLGRSLGYSMCCLTFIQEVVGQ